MTVAMFFVLTFLQELFAPAIGLRANYGRARNTRPATYHASVPPIERGVVRGLVRSLVLAPIHACAIHLRPPRPQV